MSLRQVRSKKRENLSIDKIERLRITTASPVKKPEPIIQINGSCIASAGNLVVISGRDKSGKSALTGSWLAGAIVSGEEQEVDTLGFQVSPNTNYKLVLSIDTERSDYDSYSAHEKIIKRSGEQREPVPFKNYNLRTIDHTQRLAALELILETQSIAFGGVHLVVLDGVADFVSSVLDEEECNSFVQRLTELASDYKCPIVCVLHLNPGSDFKTRGHLGSQLDRKAESSLTISRDGNISNIEPKFLRNAGEFDIIQFSYDTAAGYHSLLGSKKREKEGARLSLVSDVIQVFRVTPEMRYSELISALMELLQISKTTAKRHIDSLVKDGTLNTRQEHTKKMYSLNKQIPMQEFENTVIRSISDQKCNWVQMGPNGFTNPIEPKVQMGSSPLLGMNP